MDDPAIPRILSRPEHPISRKDIDPDALRVLSRLHQHGFTAYLVEDASAIFFWERHRKTSMWLRMPIPGKSGTFSAIPA